MLCTFIQTPTLQDIREHYWIGLPGFSKSIVLSAYADDVKVMAQNQRDVDVLVNLMLMLGVNVNLMSCFSEGKLENVLGPRHLSMVWRSPSPSPESFLEERWLVPRSFPGT